MIARGNLDRKMRPKVMSIVILLVATLKHVAHAVQMFLMLNHLHALCHGDGSSCMTKRRECCFFCQNSHVKTVNKCDSQLEMCMHE